MTTLTSNTGQFNWEVEVFCFPGEPWHRFYLNFLPETEVWHVWTALCSAHEEPEKPLTFPVSQLTVCFQQLQPEKQSTANSAQAETQLKRLEKYMCTKESMKMNDTFISIYWKPGQAFLGRDSFKQSLLVDSVKRGLAVAKDQHWKSRCWNITQGFTVKFYMCTVFSSQT